MHLSGSDRHLVNAALHLADILICKDGHPEAASKSEIAERAVFSPAPGLRHAETQTIAGDDSWLNGDDKLLTTHHPQEVDNRKDLHDRETATRPYLRFDEPNQMTSTLDGSSAADVGSSSCFGSHSREQGVAVEDSNPAVYHEYHRGSSSCADDNAGKKPKRSSVPFTRLGLRLLQATGLEARDDIDPFAEVRVESQVTRSQAISKNANPEWNDLLVFEVKNPSVAVLKVKILDGMTCFKNVDLRQQHPTVLLGELHLSIAGFAMDPKGSQVRKWHVLTKRGRTTGRLMMQVYYHGEQDVRPLRVVCKAWNVGNEEPSDSLAHSFKHLNKGGYDLVAVGVQECSYRIGPQHEDSNTGSPGQNSFGESQPTQQNTTDEQSGRRSAVRLSAAHSLKKAFDKIPQTQDTRAAFEDLIKDALGDDYCLVKSAHMRHIRLLVFASNAIFPTIFNVKSAAQATGVGGVGQNKGGIAVSLSVWDTEFCFVNSHLAAHQDKVNSRNAMYRSIVRGIRLDTYNMDILTGHHHVFWMGDLNYRIAFGRQRSSPTDEEFAAVVQMCYDKNVEDILRLDQLKQEIANKRVFQGFKEGEIQFHPTYKMERMAGNIWDPARLPAWCDRVLWKSVIQCKSASILDYYSVPEICSSDHKPVVAFFHVPRVLYTHGCTKGQVVVVDILRLYANGLFMLKKRTRKNLRAPNPQVIISGPRIKQRKTPIAVKTRDPVWSSPIRLKVKEPQLRSLLNYRLLFRVVSVSQGTTQTIGRGVLDFGQVQAKNNGKKISFSFNIGLQYNGLPAGNLSGDVKVALRATRKTRKSFTEPILDQMRKDGSRVSLLATRPSIRS